MANIRSYLKENFKLPSAGFVAGQAVASLVYKELNLNINTPINDVDVFALMEADYENFVKTKKQESEVGVVANRGSFSDQIFCISRRGYEVKLSTYLKEDENVNVVYISQLHNKEVIDKNMLLNSFDFNCCSVGYDIETGKFVWSKSFEDFINTKQLRVQSVHTPLSTLLRLNKKIEDLGTNVYCEKDVERDVLVSSLAFFGQKIQSSQIVGKRFLSLYYRYKDDFISNLITKVSINEKYRGRPDYRRINVSAKKVLGYIAKSPVGFKPLFDNVEMSEPIYVDKISRKSLRKKRERDIADYKTKNSCFEEMASIDHTLESLPLSCYQDNLSMIAEEENEIELLTMFLKKTEYPNKDVQYLITDRINIISCEALRFGNEIASVNEQETILNIEKKTFTNIPESYELVCENGCIARKKEKEILQLRCTGALPTELIYFNVNYQSFVHLYHAMKNTGVFNLKYSREIMKSMLKAVDSHVLRTEKELDSNGWRKRIIKSYLIYSEYANDITYNPLSKIKLDKKLKKYTSISKILNKHMLLTNALDENRKENESYLEIIEKLYVVAQKINKDKRREFVIGLMETKSATLDEVYAVIDSDFEEMKEYFFNLTPETMEIAKKRQVTKGFDIKLKTLSLNLKQLVTIEDFFNAGRESDNCIMGYFAEYVRKEKRVDQETQYFSMELNGVVSNIQIANGRIYQHYNKKNSRISENQKWIGLLIARRYAQTEEAKEIANEEIRKEMIRAQVKYKDLEKLNEKSRLFCITFSIMNNFSKIKEKFDCFEFFCKNKLNIKTNSAYAQRKRMETEFDDDIPF